MARKTTSKKGPSTTGTDTAGSDTSSALNPNETPASDTTGSDSSPADSLNTSLPDSSDPPPILDEGASKAQAEAAIATSDESRLAQDISRPSGDSAAFDTSPVTPDAEAAAEPTTPQDATPEVETTATDTSSAPGADAASEPAPTDETPASAGGDGGAPPKTLPPQPGPERNGGLFPLLLGGVLAGAIGYAAAYFSIPQGTDPSEVSQLRSDLSGLRAQIEAIEDPVDTTPLEAEIAALRDQIADLPRLSETALSDDVDAELAELRAQLDAGGEIDLAPLQARLDEFNDSLSQQAAGVADELDSLRTALTEAEARIATLGADLEDVRDLSERRVIEAEAAVDAALARSGLDSLRAALETGAPYTDALARLSEAGVAVPDALAAPAPTGIPTVEALQESFPQAARDALRVALQDAPADSTADRLGNFLRAQVGARSTTPRAGDDPDAILSRAEAAVEAGDLETALSEIDALSAAAQAAMGDWLNAAQARIAARDALPELTNAITTE